MNMQLSLLEAPPPAHCGPIVKADQEALLAALERITAGDCVEGVGESIADFTGMPEGDAVAIARLFFRVVRDARVARYSVVEEAPPVLRKVVRP